MSGRLGWLNTPLPWNFQATGSLESASTSNGRRSSGPRAFSFTLRTIPAMPGSCTLVPSRAITASVRSPRPVRRTAPVTRPLVRKAPVVAASCRSAEVASPSFRVRAPDTFSPPASAAMSCISKPSSVKRNAALALAGPKLLGPSTATAPSTS